MSQAFDHHALLGGLRFHYREWPNPGKQALVLLHGFTGHAHSWESFAAAMQPDYHVYALDQRGHGDSSWTETYSTGEMVEDVQRWVTALGLQKFVLLGLSMGGRVACQFAAEHPEEVERLVIVDIGPELTRGGAARVMDGARATDVFATPEDAVAAAREANPNADEHESRHRTLHNLMLRDDGTWTYRYDKGLRDGSRTLMRPDSADGWALLRRITAPSLLVRGEVSDLLSPEIAGRMLREIPQCAFAEVPGAGHSIPLERPQGFLAAVRTFL